LPREIPWHKGLLKKLQKSAKNPMNEIWSLDERHFQQHGSRCVMWVPPELNPIERVMKYYVNYAVLFKSSCIIINFNIVSLKFGIVRIVNNL
jgi:hypothetical protein